MINHEGKFIWVKNLDADNFSDKTRMPHTAKDERIKDNI